MRRSRLGELLVRGILKASPRTIAGRAWLKALITARMGLIRARHPLIRLRIARFDLLLPLAHELPFYLHDHPRYGAPLGGIARQAGGPVVDVGANVGDSAARIRTETVAPILCVEGDPRFFAVLRENAAQLGEVELEQAFVAAEGGTIHARLERTGGTTRLVPGAEEVRVRTLSEILADHPRFAEPALVKLDTDGFDVPILLAELELLARLRPILFFEYDPALGAEAVVFERLREVGYATAHVFENTGELARTIDMDDREATAELHREYSGHGGARYADICALPSGRALLRSSAA